MGRPLSPKDLERVQEAVAKLVGAAETTDADWAKLRTEFKRLTVTKLSELREQAQADLEAKRLSPAMIDLRNRFPWAVELYEDICAKMDQVFSRSLDGEDVDAKAGIAAMNVKRQALTDLTKLMNLMAPEQEDAAQDSELEKGVREYFGGLFPDSESLPAIEILRLAYQRLEAVEMAEKRKLRVVG